MENKTGKTTKALFILTVLFVLGTFAYNFYTFYFERSYTFLVEAGCSEGESCFLRHCGEEECPPSGFEAYRMFAIAASDFSQCTDDTCLAQCISGEIACEEVMCGDAEGDICSFPAGQ